VVSRNLPESLKQASKDALGHSPHDRVLKLIGRHHPTIPPDLEPYVVVRGGVKKVVQGNPTGLRHLKVGPEHGTDWGQENEGTHGDGWQERSSGHHILDDADECRLLQMDSHLLPGFPDGGGEKIAIVGLTPTTGQGHMPAPGISGALGPANQKNAIRIRGENDGYGGPDQRWIIIPAGFEAGQPLAQAEEPRGQCECEWQAPPQQPPPAGGPSRL
jgi:hypothetical protein